ncbi:MAG: hemerythrin family protein [Synergistaceae bacterium]|jgi:hemerythrin|nr:hemerythrin family protein [Synergistaceae bacterium]
MAYEWDPSLETGHEVIDSQHQQLIAAVNNIYDACCCGNRDVELTNTLDFLNCYIVKHFSEEERIMIEYGYPDYEYHRRYHEMFKVDIRDMTRKLMQDGVSESIVKEILGSIIDWLINHIKSDDFRFTACISSTREPLIK